MSANSLLFQIQAAKLPTPQPEFRFHFPEFIIPGVQIVKKQRLWRADFAWPDQMLLVEYEGGVFTGGAHTRGQHFESDAVKYNTATLMGYRVLRFTASQVKSGYALTTIGHALGVKL